MSRREVFRKYIAPVLLGVAIVLLARDSCNKGEHAHATIVLDFGRAVDQVRSVDAELWVGDDEVSTFHHNGASSLPGPWKFEALLPGSDGELRIDLETRSGPRHIVRHVHVEEGATVTVSLEREL